MSNASRLKPLNKRLTPSQRQTRAEHIERKRLKEGTCAKCGTFVPIADRNGRVGYWVAT